MEYKIRHSFVCNKCKENCGACVEELNGINNGIWIDDELYPRKQLIGCLGKYCDEPCKLQIEETNLTVEDCIRLINWMGNKLNNLLITS